MLPPYHRCVQQYPLVWLCNNPVSQSPKGQQTGLWLPVVYHGTDNVIKATHSWPCEWLPLTLWQLTVVWWLSLFVTKSLFVTSCQARQGTVWQSLFLAHVWHCHLQCLKHFQLKLVTYCVCRPLDGQTISGRQFLAIYYWSLHNFTDPISRIVRPQNRASFDLVSSCLSTLSPVQVWGSDTTTLYHCFPLGPPTSHLFPSSDLHSPPSCDFPFSLVPGASLPLLPFLICLHPSLPNSFHSASNQSSNDITQHPHPPVLWELRDPTQGKTVMDSLTLDKEQFGTSRLLCHPLTAIWG